MRVMRGGVTRPGTTLVELLVALPIAAIITTLAILLLLATHRQARRQDAGAGTVRELRHAALVAGAELRPLQSRDLIAWSDTTLEFDAVVATGVACDTRMRGTHIDVLPESDADPLGMRAIAPVQAGDRVSAWLAPSAPSLAPVGFVSRASAGAGEGGCLALPLRGAGAAIRLPLDDSLPSQVAEGTPVRVTRRTRYQLYRAGDGLWYLGRATRPRLVWDIVQPLAGPFSSPAERGVRFVVVDSAGATLRVGPSDAAAAVRLELRAHRVAGERGTDSVFVAMALRGRNDD